MDFPFSSLSSPRLVDPAWLQHSSASDSRCFHRYKTIPPLLTLPLSVINTAKGLRRSSCGVKEGNPASTGLMLRRDLNAARSGIAHILTYQLGIFITFFSRIIDITTIATLKREQKLPPFLCTVHFIFFPMQ